MSESDNLALQALAHKNLKTARAKVASITATLIEHAKHYEEVARMLRQFVADPRSRNLGELEISGPLKESVEATPDDRVTTLLIDELLTETGHVRQLEEQIERF